MARLIGYVSNRADRLAKALEREREVVVSPLPQQPTGWGLGFFQGGEALYKKCPNLEGSRLDWGEITSNIVSDCAVIHIRQPTAGDFRTENTHPFRSEGWLFAHHGTVSGFDRVEKQMRESLPEFLQRRIRGQTDSEIFFAHILAQLFERGQTGSLHVRDKDVVDSLEHAVAIIDEFTDKLGVPRSTLNAVLTNGRQMFVLRRGEAFLWMSKHDSLMHASPSHSRYVMAVSGLQEPQGNFRMLDDSSILVVHRDLSTERIPLG